jgi:hypothetical protein
MAAFVDVPEEELDFGKTSDEDFLICLSLSPGAEVLVFAGVASFLAGWGLTALVTGRATSPVNPPAGASILAVA